MLKQTTYKEKFGMIAGWMPFMMEHVKKDLKNEHLKKDMHFARHYLAGRDLQKLSNQDLAAIYVDAMANNEKAEELGEYIANRWLMKHGDLYNYFADELSQIASDFSELDILDEATSLKIMEGSIREFGAPSTYLFCVMNSVVFPESVFAALATRAEEEVASLQTKAIENKIIQDLQEMQQNYELQISRLTDKYEKKLQGLQKKYHTDVTLLKNQVATLTRKLSAKN